MRGKSLGAWSRYHFRFGPRFNAYEKELFDKWELVLQRKRSRTLFAQETIRFEEVARELEEARSNVGSREETNSLYRCFAGFRCGIARMK